MRLRSIAYGRAAVLVSLVLLCAAARGKPDVPVTRVVYANDSLLLDDAGRPLRGAALTRRMALLKEAYGTELFIIDYVNEPPPAEPRRLEGIVIHIDPDPRTGDPKWVVGDRNPLLDFAGVRRQVTRLFPGIRDLDDKYDGYRFITKVVPENGAPTMKLGSRFNRGPLSKPVREGIERHVDETLRKYGLDPAANRELRARAIRLGKIQTRINETLGTSFVKVRDLNNSEGRLPRSNKDWADLYVDYWVNVKPKVVEAEARSAAEGIPLPELLVEIPRAEGRVLDVLLENPGKVVVQKREELHREVRAHFVEGELLEGTTFLRFYRPNEYLPSHERAAIEGFVREVFVPGLERLGLDPKRFSMTPDIVILKKPGLKRALAQARAGNHRALYRFIRILDENVDMQSGYFYPQEDLFTTGRFAKRFTGRDTVFLREFEEFKGLPLGPAKVGRLRAILERYAPFLKGNVQESFWDRVISHYQEVLARSPTNDRFDAILSEMRAAGLKVGTIFLQFINEAQETHEKLKLAPKRAREWADFLNRLDPEIRTVVNRDGRLRDEEKVNSLTCKVYKELGPADH